MLSVRRTTCSICCGVGADLAESTEDRPDPGAPPGWSRRCWRCYGVDGGFLLIVLGVEDDAWVVTTRMAFETQLRRMHAIGHMTSGGLVDVLDEVETARLYPLVRNPEIGRYDTQEEFTAYTHKKVEAVNGGLRDLMDNVDDDEEDYYA